MYVLSPRPPAAKLPVFFNIDAHVGPGCPNKEIDVMLVQFLLKTMGSVPLPGSNLPTDLKGRMTQVRCDGKCDAYTCALILDYQKFLKTEQPGIVADGKVSPSSGGVGYGTGPYTICTLNRNVKSRFMTLWPILGQMPNCPALLAKAATYALSGEI
jgi:hypothetical protein